ncbi:MAG: DUF3137 domain-containing protein [Bacteroidota bacterium]
MENSFPLAERLSAFEKFRKSLARKAKIYRTLTKPFRLAYIAAGILLLISAVLPFLAPVFLPFILAGLGLFIVEIILHNFVFKDPEGRFEKRFKEELIADLMAAYFPELTYQPRAMIKQEAVDFSGLFGRKIERYIGEDYFEGKVNGVGLRFSELRLLQEKYGLKEFFGDVADEVLSSIFGGEDDFGDEQGNLVTVFNGLFFHLGFHMSFKGSLLILSQGSQWTEVFKKSHRRGRERVQTGDLDFDVCFELYASPGLDLAQVLLPATRNHLIRLQREQAPDLAASIRDGQMFVAIPSNKDLLEADLYKGLPSEEEVKDYLAEVRLIHEVVGDMYGK